MPKSNPISRKKVLVLSHDTAGKTMAGPGIRYVSIARELSRHFDTTLGLLNGTGQQINELSAYGIKAVAYSDGDYQEMVDGAEYLFGQQLGLGMLRYARRQQKRIIVDLYAPVPVEFLLYRHFSRDGISSLEKQEIGNLIDTYKEYVRTCDYFVCSNDRQRDMWLGFMLANNVLESRDEVCQDIERLIGLAPMGISSDEPRHKQDVMRDVVPGIGKDDFILLWTGGLWDWFDPLKVVQAVERLNKDLPRIKLVFMGVRRPNKKVPDMSEAEKTITYVKERDLENDSVFFIDSWLPYEERVNYLLEADAAIYAHKSSLETRYSHRSRVLDHIYTELPTVANGGDYLGDAVLKDRGLGVVVENDDIDSFAKTVTKLASDKELYTSIKKNIAAAKEEFYWENTVKPLVDYINDNTAASPLRTQQMNTSGPKQGVLFQIRRVMRKIKRHVS